MNKWYGNIKDAQIDKTKPIFIDRQNEIERFYGVSKFYLWKYYIQKGLPKSERFKEHYIRAFRGNVGPDKLKGAYDSVSFDYTLRLMLGYERYSLITDYLDYMVNDSGLELNEFNILDYGCGVSDIGLLFCSFGATVTICDLDNRRFDFVLERFKRRGYVPSTIRIKDTEIYPELPEKEYDLIIATELFEHVRDPLKLLKNFAKALKRGGYLLDSMGGEFERDDRPHHLREAFQIGQSIEYKSYYQNSFKHLSPGSGMRFLFQKN
jgi:2-polyprenyl-3-methyl-5-hydroxy-6-metoxy-1,4-benzoquinol methylase